MALQPIGLDATLKNVPDFTGGIDKMNRAVDSFASNSTKQAGMFSSGFGEIVTGALRKVGELGVQALMQAGRAVAGFVKDSIGLAGDFEAGMLEFQSVAGREVDTAGLEKFHDLFLDIGKRLPVSTAEVQKAAIEMVKGGIDPATIAAGGLEQNIQFAAAAMGGDLVKAAEISSKIMGGWAGVNATAAEKADFLTHATDLLAKAANASSTDVEGLALGIFNSQGIARTAGVSFDDLTTTLAALAPRFESSSVAGNSLKNMIARLQPTTDPAAQAMAKLGLYTAETGSAFYDAQGNFVGFETASQLLQTSLQGLTNEQKAAALQTIFGNDAMGAAAGLAELGADGYQHMAEALLNANGVSEAAALKQQGFNTALDNAKGSVEALQIGIGEKLLPILTTLLNDTIAPAINMFGDWAVAILGAGDPMQALITSIDEIVPGFQSFVSGVETGIGIIQDLVGWFNTASTESDGLGGAIEKLNGVFTLALTVITNVGNGYMAIAQAVLPIIQNLWTDHGTEISAFLKTTYDSIIKIVTLALQLYNAIVPPILNAIAGFFRDHGSEVEKILAGAGQAFGAIVTGFMETLKGIFTVALAVLSGDWDAAWQGILDIGKAQTTAIGGVITGFLTMIAGLFDTSLAEIAQVWENNWNMLVEIAMKIGDRMVNVGASIVEGIKKGISDAWESLKKWLSDKISSLPGVGQEAQEGGSPAMLWTPVGQSAVQGIMQGFQETWPSLTALIGSLSEDLIGQMESVGRDMQNVIADSFGATASIDRQIAANLDRFKDILPQYQQFTQGALKEAQLQAVEFLDPAEGAKFFAMRSKQILEYAKLQQELAQAETQADRERIEAKMLLINAAQSAELAQFNANQAGQQSPTQQLADQIQSMLDSIGAVTRDNPLAPVVDILQALLGQAQTPVTTQPRTPYNPGPTTNNSHLLNMPIYTNMSPTAIQDSMAIARAAML